MISAMSKRYDTCLRQELTLTGNGGEESTERTPLVALHIGTNDPARLLLKQNPE